MFAFTGGTNNPHCMNTDHGRLIFDPLALLSPRLSNFKMIAAKLDPLAAVFSKLCANEHAAAKLHSPCLVVISSKPIDLKKMAAKLDPFAASAARQMDDGEF